LTPATNRIDRRFAELAAAGRKGLIPYVTAGHPHPDATAAAVADGGGESDRANPQREGSET